MTEGGHDDSGEDHEHDHASHFDPHARVHLFHATAPTCWWSWGYEGVLNRVHLVYGDQVQIHLLQGCVYEDVAEYAKHYDVDDEGMDDWRREGEEIMGVQIAKPPPMARWPRSMFPATLAVAAAYRQGEREGRRLSRVLLRRWNLDGQDVTTPAAIGDAAREAGLDLARFTADLRDEAGLRRFLEHQGHGFPHLPVGFYNIVLSDGAGTSVVMDNAFEPGPVERAIDFLANGPLRKQEPTDIEAYLRDVGPAPLVEIARVFGLSEKEAADRLAAIAKRGKAKEMAVGPATLWTEA